MREFRVDLQQLRWFALFHDMAGPHDNDRVEIEDLVEAMCDYNHSSPVKFFRDDLLHHSLCVIVHAS